MELPFYSHIEKQIKNELEDIQTLFLASQSSILLQDKKQEFEKQKSIHENRLQRVQAKAKGIVTNKSSAFLYTHLGLGDMFWMNGAVRYLSTYYDILIVVCKKQYENEVKAMYRDDPTIQLYIIDNDDVLHPFYSQKRHEIGKFVTKVYGCGLFSTDKNYDTYDFPYCFYDELNIPRNVRQDYFFTIPLQEGFERVKIIQNALGEKKYVVFHQQATHSTIQVSNDFDKEQTLLLDVNKNLYPKEHPWYELAQSIVNQPLLSHIPLFENAEEIHMLESSVYCLVSHLNLSKVKRKVCYNPYDDSANRIGVFESKEVTKFPPVV